MQKNKNIYRAILLLSFLGLNALILFGISSVWSYLNTGADRSTMLHVRKELNASYLPKIIWRDVVNEGRPMEDQTLHDIERDYMNAWHIRNSAYANNDISGIADYYTDSARVKLYDIILLNKAKGITLEMTTIEHYPTIEFYSEDGQIVVFTDTNIASHSEVYSNKKHIATQKDTTNYQIMMLLEDGFWRIRHQVELPIKQDTITQKRTKPKTLLKKVSQLKGINYYPQKTPWNMFGNQFNDTVVGNDFALIQKMGWNTIRIFVPYADFGKAEITAEKIQRLRATLDLAEVYKLKVVVTLFDFYGDYEVQDWTLTHRHAEQLVSTFAEHKAILAWDIKNEPDLDFDSRGKEKVLAWLDQMAKLIKTWDTNHLVTIGWSNTKAAELLVDEVDFVSFHYYNDVVEFSDAYASLKKAVPNKLLVLQEYGYSSYDGIWSGYLGSQEKQAEYYKEMQFILEKEQVPFLFWTLYDFEEIPTSVVGRLPWRKQRQAYFGILDTKGKPKTAYSYLTAD